MDMERLTREETIVVRGKEMAACNYENDDCNDSCRYGRCRWQEKANMLLKEYEDTGLTPPEIMKLKGRDTAKPTRPIRDRSLYAICLNCGQTIFRDHRFCPDCGRRLEQ